MHRIILKSRAQFIVTEKKMSSVAATPVKESMTAVEQEPIMTEEMEPAREQTQEPTLEITQMTTTTRSNEFLIIRIATPETIEIDSGETVTWRNLQRPKLPIVLVSDDGLWEDYTIYYGKIFSYTFEKPGTYAFSVKDNPAIKGTYCRNISLWERNFPILSISQVNRSYWNISFSSFSIALFIRGL